MFDNEINNFIQMSWERTRILDDQGHMLRGDERLKEKTDSGRKQKNMIQYKKGGTKL